MLLYRCPAKLKKMVPGAGVEPARVSPREFKSLVSTGFTTRARIPTWGHPYYKRLALRRIGR